MVKLSRQEILGSEDYLSSTELLNNGCHRVFAIEICRDKLVKMLLAVLIYYQMQTFPTKISQLAERKHVTLSGKAI